MTKRYPRTILLPVVTPWDEQFRFDETTFRKMVRKNIETGFKHLYLFGTAGEGYAITDEQFTEIVQVFADEMQAPDVFPMVGLIALSLPTMHKRLQVAYDLGIREFQFVLPSWGALSDKEMNLFFHDLCDAYPECQFIHYNLPRTKRVVTPEEYRVLADEIPNLVGAKYTTSEIGIIHKLLDVPNPMQFFLGETGFGYGSMIGECGLLSSFGNINPEKSWDYFNAAVNNDNNKVLNYIGEYSKLLTVLFEKVKPGKIDGAYDKVFSRHVDPNYPLRLLAPYESVTESQFDEYLSYFKVQMPGW